MEQISWENKKIANLGKESLAGSWKVIKKENEIGGEIYEKLFGLGESILIEAGVREKKSRIGRK